MSGEQAGDEELMLRYRDGDVAAFDTLYARHRGPLFRYLARQCGERAIAEELFQDVWMNLIRSRQRYEVRASFKTLLYRMAHNRLVDHYRSRGSRPNPGHGEGLDPDALPNPDPSQEARLESARRAGDLARALAALPGEQREAFLLHEEAGLGLEAIAETTGVGRETVKSRLRYALAKLRAALAEEA